MNHCLSGQNTFFPYVTLSGRNIVILNEVKNLVYESAVRNHRGAPDPSLRLEASFRMTTLCIRSFADAQDDNVAADAQDDKSGSVQDGRRDILFRYPGSEGFTVL